MKYFNLPISFLVLLALNSGIAFGATTPARQTIPAPKNVNVTVTSNDCVANLEKLRVAGLKEMKARRDAALAKAKLLPTNEARKEASRKAQDVYNAEMKVASRQLEAAKALCKKPVPKVEKKTVAPDLQKKVVLPPIKTTVPETKPSSSAPKSVAEPLVSPPLPEVPPKVNVVIPVKPILPAVVQVEISNFAFSPNSIKIKKGDTVVWTNKDGASHTVTSDTNAFSSDFLATGQSFKFTFDKTGSFQYHCTPHRSMIAIVEVVE